MSKSHITRWRMFHLQAKDLDGEWRTLATSPTNPDVLHKAMTAMQSSGVEEVRVIEQVTTWYLYSQV